MASSSELMIQDDDKVRVTLTLMTLICNTNTTLSAECPEQVTIIPASGQFEPGDVLTCSADGYDPTYTWTGVLNGESIGTQTGSTYTLLEGDFQVICTATISKLTCTEQLQSVEGSAFGKYRIQLTTVLRMSILAHCL